ncbi:phenoloxidase subunit 1-like [Phymastichus coffea]|uniref:phenoloxidase subunit 1-like n=1 Tax=Phymastichus coffea TaxID=108790 RepID=UPI00273ACB02|nr:phenoloxidase subunit 1-like [Phymastichus coffea]
MEKNLLLLFDRPSEPVFVPKGENKVGFEVPASYLKEEYQPIAQRILTRFGEEANTTIPIKQIAIPDLKIPLSVGRYEAFSLFIPRHQKSAAYLTELFLGMRTVEDLISLAAYCRDRINPEMFTYSLSVAILHRSDTKHLPIPHLSEIFPSKYLDSGIFNRAKEAANVAPVGTRLPIEIPLTWTGSNSNPEQRVAYFREDVGINLHHWHWHLVYPASGPPETVAKNRRGELFYYMHHQAMARYNTERICNGLARVQPLTNFRETISDGYFPKLEETVSGRAWPSRPANMNLSDINRPSDDINFTVDHLETWRDRILEAIRNRAAQSSSGGLIALDEETGIDILGNMVEASILSPNSDYYGSVHNSGHDCIAFIHDPNHYYLETFGVMGSNTTAMRDPVFYRWHAFVDWLFHQFLDSLPPYTEQQLNFPGIIVQDIRINSPNSNPNTLNSHWSKTDIDLSRGLDFTPRGAILARIQHLDHDAFSYSFTINNSNNVEVTGTIRVFIAPKTDENGRQLSQDEQRMLMIEMDKFTTRLRRGQNIITRNSTESAVTIPFEATFRDLNNNRPQDSDLQNFDSFNFCGCGWPQHMLVPKGTENGFAMDLFLMVSDYQQDKIDQAEPTGCRDGVSFCGLRDLKYPDRRGMGFPFDRKARAGVSSMTDFLTSNMKLQQITVRFSNQIRSRQSGNIRRVNWQ